MKASSHAAALEEGAMEDAHEYHAALLEFERQGFPTLDDDGRTNGLQLSWKAAWAPATAKPETHSSLLWDRSCVTYNIVALLSFQVSRSSSSCNNNRDECKRGVGLCQQAASILETLSELASSQDFATVDLSSPMLQFWKAFFLAQGQSFVYRMASLGPTPSASGSSQNHGTLAGLSQAAYKLFNEALAKAQDARLQSEVPQPSEQWASYCKGQAMMAAARAEYHEAVVERLAYHHGSEIVRLRQSLATTIATAITIVVATKETAAGRGRQFTSVRSVRTT
jgi:BRO1-like domain